MSLNNPFFDNLRAHEQSEDHEGQTQDAHVTTDNQEEEGGLEVETATSYSNDTLLLPAPNNNPQRKVTYVNGKRLTRLIRKTKNYFFPPPSLEEIKVMEERRALAQLNKTLKEEAKEIGSVFSNALHRMGLSYVRFDGQGGVKKISKVRFDTVVSTQDAHWFHVDSYRLPYLVSHSKLWDKEVVEDLGKSIRHKVSVRATDETGVWYIVERASGIMGIPGYVQMLEMWERFPPTANRLTIPLGMGQNRKPYYEDLDDMVHILICGQTGKGKSNTIAVFLTTLITRNSPQQLQLLLLDMKRGLEFQFYEGLPHLVKIPDVTETGIIEEPDLVFPAFSWLLEHEAKKRLNIIREAGKRDIKAYNARRKNPMPYMVICCDEWAIARMGAKGKEAERELAKAVQLLRAVGIVVIICTQTPTRDVLGSLVKSNLPTRIVLAFSDISASVMVINSGDAVGLSPVGRAIYYKDGARIPIQIPKVPTELIQEVVSNAIEGKTNLPTQAKRHDVTLLDILEWALHENNGQLQVDTTYSHFAHRHITKEEVRLMLMGIDKSYQEVNGKTYFVQPDKGSRPRVLVAKEEPDNETH